MYTPSELEPLDPEVLVKLRRISTATLATRLFAIGLRDQYMVGLSPMNERMDGFVGEAYTMRFVPSREDIDTLESLKAGDNLQWLGVESLEPQQVLVIDSRGDVSAASAGDMLVTRAFKKGAAAIVTDGAFRDGYVIKEIPFPTYSRAITSTTRLSRFHVADLQVPIGCAGVAVYPGDVLVGDRDGVIVIPRHIAPTIVDEALEQEELEAYLHTRVHNGEPLMGGIYPPNEKTKAEYRQWKSAGPPLSLPNGAGPVAFSGLDSQEQRDRMEKTIRRYFDGCNEADVEKIAACFTEGAVHYFPPGLEGPWVGNRTIAENWRELVLTIGSAWTIERLIAEPASLQAVIEWTHYKTNLGGFVRGDEWYQFDPETGLIAEIRAYYASAADGRRQVELQGYDYEANGYHLRSPIERENAVSVEDAVAASIGVSVEAKES
jgi:regulator of RNase E activity RraA